MPGILQKTASANEQDRHLEQIGTLLFHDGVLLSGADDGNIKVWSKDLKLLGDTKAHQVNVFSLAANGDVIYSCSNDGTICSWKLPKGGGPLTTECIVRPVNEVEVLRLRFAAGKLYAGDVRGNVLVYKDNHFQGQYEMLEEIADMEVFNGMLFTGRYNDIVATELHGEKMSFMTRCTMPGMVPLSVNSKYVAFVNRDGRTICLRENNKTSNFKEIANVPAHDMVIQAMAFSKDGGKLYTSAYDKLVRCWSVSNPDQLIKQGCTAEIDVGEVISAMCCGDSGELYAAGPNGFLCKIEQS